MNETAPAISIVIPTWNRCGLLFECLHSLDCQTFRDFEIIVVEDGGTDDTVALLRSRRPEVRLVERTANGGFARAANDGILLARGEYIFLLNNDMTLHPDCLALLIAQARRSGMDMLSPLVLWRDNPETVYAAGDRIRRSGRPESIGFRMPRAALAIQEEVFGVSAGAGLYHRRVFDVVGMLDERFVAYFEDSDLSLRARLAGFRAGLCAKAVALHVGSASLEGRTWWRSRQCYRNHALLVLKNFPLSLILRNAGPILRERLHQARTCFNAARAAFGAVRAAGTLARAWLELWTLLPGSLAARRAIQRRRVLKTHELRTWLDAGRGGDGD